LIVAKIVLDKY